MPDHVVAIFFLRDGTNLCTSLRCYEEVLAEIKSEYSSRLLYKYSAVARREFSTFYAEQIQNAYLSDETEIWQQQQAALQHIQALCQENGSSFDLVIFPILFDLNENYPFHEVESEILRFANMANIPAFSLTSGFLGQSAEDLWVSPNDQHPNELGHKIAAETLLPFLIEILGNRNRLHND